jgi:hypothetical protein
MDKLELIELPEEIKKIPENLKPLIFAIDSLCNFLKEEKLLWIDKNRSKTMDRIVQLKSLCFWFYRNALLEKPPLYFIIVIKEYPFDITKLLLCFITFDKSNRKETIRKKFKLLDLYTEFSIILIEVLNKTYKDFDYDEILSNKVKIFRIRT